MHLESLYLKKNFYMILYVWKYAFQKENIIYVFKENAFRKI